MKATRLLILGVAALLVAYYIEVIEARRLREQVHSLSLQLAQVDCAEHISAESKDSSAVTAEIPDTASQIDSSAASTNEYSQTKNTFQPQEDLKKLRAEVSATRKLKELDEVLALSQDERSKLEKRLGDFFSVEPSEVSSADTERMVELEQLLSEELGPERADLYSRIQKDRETKAAEEKFDLVTTMFTKRLSLSAKQGAQLLDILRGIDLQLGTPGQMLEQKLKDLRLKGEEITDSPAQALKQYSDISNQLREQRRSVLNAQLKDVLTPDQYNTLLSEEANAQDWLWGLNGY